LVKDDETNHPPEWNLRGLRLESTPPPVSLKTRHRHYRSSLTVLSSGTWRNKARVGNAAENAAPDGTGQVLIASQLPFKEPSSSRQGQI
jgi:hypothetical protein